MCIRDRPSSQALRLLLRLPCLSPELQTSNVNAVKARSKHLWYRQPRPRLLPRPLSLWRKSAETSWHLKVRPPSLQKTSRLWSLRQLNPDVYKRQLPQRVLYNYHKRLCNRIITESIRAASSVTLSGYYAMDL